MALHPFYPEDPHASFGKHVLTPTLALTSVAASTPPGCVEISRRRYVRGRRRREARPGAAAHAAVRAGGIG